MNQFNLVCHFSIFLYSFWDCTAYICQRQVLLCVVALLISFQARIPRHIHALALTPPLATAIAPQSFTSVDFFLVKLHKCSFSVSQLSEILRQSTNIHEHDILFSLSTVSSVPHFVNFPNTETDLYKPVYADTTRQDSSRRRRLLILPTT